MSPDTNFHVRECVEGFAEFFWGALYVRSLTVKGLSYTEATFFPICNEVRAPVQNLCFAVFPDNIRMRGLP